LATSAGAGERAWYVGIEGGVEFDGGSNVDDSGWAALVTIGRGLTDHLSLEGEVGYRSTSPAGGLWWMASDIDQLSFMGNLIYEAPLGKEVSVAVGVGIGGDQVRQEYGSGFSKSEMEVMGQLKLGLSIAVTESTELVANYRYTESITSSPVDNSTLTVGLRFAL
jgi:opacity protein-like surface antigen